MPEDRYNIYRSTVHWRYAMARPHLMFFDARLIFFIILFVFHIRWWTFAVLVFAIAGFTGASYFNYSLENVTRLARSKIVGPFRPAMAYTRLRPMVDFGSDALRNDYIVVGNVTTPFLYAAFFTKAQSRCQRFIERWRVFRLTNRESRHVLRSILSIQNSRFSTRDGVKFVGIKVNWLSSSRPQVLRDDF